MLIRDGGQSFGTSGLCYLMENESMPVPNANGLVVRGCLFHKSMTSYNQVFFLDGQLLVRFGNFC